MAFGEVQHKYRIGVRVAGISIAAAVLAGCGGSGLAESLGYTKNAPDEFAIVTKAPLVIPPDFALRPPQPGAPRPTQLAPQRVAEQAIYGNTAGVVATPFTTGNVRSQGESQLLANAGALDADPNIRAVVNAETRALAAKSETFMDDVIFWQQQPSPDEHVVDASEEMQRLRENEAAGRPVTEGETPAIEPRRKGLLEGIF